MDAQNLYYTLLIPLDDGFAVIMGVCWLTLAYFATRVEHGLAGVRIIVVILVACLLIFVIGNIPIFAYMGLYDARQLFRQ